MTFTILGGDLRSVYLARRLLGDGHRVQTHGLDAAPPMCRRDTVEDALAGTDCVVLPIPASGDPIPRDPIPDHVPVFGAELLQSEPLAIGNAALTAQAATGLILLHYPDLLMGAHAVILGAGRIGKLLGLGLRALGARVTVTARREEDKAWCAALGLHVGDTRDLGPLLPSCQILVNTVPAPVLDGKDLDLLPRGALLMELASLPGGFDPTEAEARGIQPIIGRGLPGKYAPKAAADLIAETIYQRLEL